MSNPNRNGDVFQLSNVLDGYQDRNLGVPNGLIGLDLLDLPSPYNTIHRINSKIDGSFEAVDRQGELVALLPIESVVFLHFEYGVTLGENARTRIIGYFRKESRYPIGVIGSWKPR